MTKFVKVCITLSYVVPADEDEAIEFAKNSLHEDLMNAYKYGEVYDLIDVEEAPDADYSDVPDFISELITESVLKDDEEQPK